MIYLNKIYIYNLDKLFLTNINFSCLNMTAQVIRVQNICRNIIAVGRNYSLVLKYIPPKIKINQNLN